MRWPLNMSAENIAVLLPNPPEIFSGPVQLLIYANRCPEQEMAEDSGSAATLRRQIAKLSHALRVIWAFASIREIADWDVEHRLPINELVREDFAPVIQRCRGFHPVSFISLSRCRKKASSP